MTEPTNALRTPAPRSTLGILFLTVFVDLLGFGIVIPLLPYYAHRFAASGVTAGALVACYSAMQLVFAPLWGRLSDRVGRRPVMLVSLAASTLSYALFASATGLGMLFLSRLLAGAGGANIAVAQAFIADVTSDEERAKGMGVIGAAFGLGFVFGPAIGGLLAAYGHWAPGAAAALICGANLVIAIVRLPESLPSARRSMSDAPREHPLRHVGRALQHAQLTPLLVLFFVVVFAFATMETTLSLLCATYFQLPAAQIYWLFGFMGLTMSVVQGGLIGRLASYTDERRMVTGGCALLAIGLLATPFAYPFAPLLVALALVACGQGIASPTLSSLISKVSSAAEQGGVLGLSQSMGSLARILGPLWGGLLFDWGPAGPFVSTGLLMVAATVVAARLGRATATAAAPAPRLPASP
ncbi:MAG: MFS transporter [Deltaproteobacteria bacterium]|nr:MFS transporter [Deltaproteobacteria bacterium]MBI3386153.1 MFS transporter [Deltaproteobacteria bacterium]